MARSITTATLQAFASDSVRLANLISIDFDTPIYLTDYAHDLTVGLTTYEASSHLLAVAEPSETRDLTVGSINFGISGVSQEYISIFLNQDWINRVVILSKVAIDESGTVIGDPVVLFNGHLTQFGISDSKDSSEITATAASHWADFEKKNGRTTNNNSQQFHFAGDLGMEYAANAVKDLKWGK